MKNRKMEELIRGRAIDLSRHHWIPRLILSTLILLTSIVIFGNLIGESMASESPQQQTSKSKVDKPKETIASSEKTTEFIPSYRFSEDEFVMNLGKVLLSEDGRTTRETVERAFNVKFSDKPVKDAEKNYPNMSRFYLRPRVDWYFGMGLTLGEKVSSFQLSLDSTMCIHYKDFREIAKAAGWKLVGEAQFFYHQPILREEYLKAKGAILIVDLSDGNSDCITYINMYNRS